MDSNALHQEKLEQVCGILRELDLDAWLIMERETALLADPVSELLWDFVVVFPAVFVITADGQRIASGVKSDVPIFTNSGLFTEVIRYHRQPEETLPAIIEKLDPRTIALNYSEGDVTADGLSHGLYLRLMRMFDGTPYAERFVSAERLVGSLRQRKTASELALLKEAAKTADEIFRGFSEVLRPGMSETEMAALILNDVEARGIGTSWDASQCPNVNAGPDTGRGHLGPQPHVLLEGGHILNVDFGVKQRGYCSDHQRMWYVLRDGETQPPDDVRKHFCAIRDAIRAGFDAFRPGVEGWEVDAAARTLIGDAGYPVFNHALGHNVGRYAHDGGIAAPSPRWPSYGARPCGILEPGQVLTLELGFWNEHGYFGLEEEVVVTESGAEWFSPPQEELILVPSRAEWESHFCDAGIEPDGH